ncbi:MAG: dihydrodipicolinate synthase family protein [Nocardioides sp.]|uniref:dihydrodipicolinate synthase family protein n=1 Tax=Nocardioides sp. TaxID=35761 RepID=UPI0039E34266
MTSIDLPDADRTWSAHTLREPTSWAQPATPLTVRIAYAAAHVVTDPFGDNVPGAPAVIDWDATLGFRCHLFSYGLGLAEAMDTAQRGMGLDWPATQELIRRSAAEAAAAGARVAAGAGTDHLADDITDLDSILAGYEEQTAFVESTGARAIIMASRQLARAARDTEDYRKVYDRLLAQTEGPVILHWLGTAFDPALAGYWGSADVSTATDAFLDLVRDNAEKVDGVKVSLLDAEHEKALRAALPTDVRLYTGDDFNYPELIQGDGAHYSDALLGIFAGIAPAASAALQALEGGNVDDYDAAFGPTLPLARHVFAAPTYYYKTGIAFLAWLCGHQSGFGMVGGLQNGRSPLHLVETFRLADAAGLLPDPDLAAERMGTFLASVGMTR